MEMIHRYRGVVHREATNPLIVDIVGPARIDKTINGALDQEIAKMKWIENASVVDCDGRLIDHDRA
jgi:hypothetical protein